MDSNVTIISPQSEPDQDNSSLQNPSTNPAEAGTNDETSRDEDHETSSIEALNWSEVEEEELAAAQKSESAATAAAAQGKQNLDANVNGNDKTEDNVTNNGSSLTDEGSLLSTTLLKSIDSSVSDEDPQARKLSVIENWASEVTNAVERGEIEMTEDFPDENGTTGDDEGEVDAAGKGLRKRKGKKYAADMISSITSSASNGESIGDPLSNAPVLDDGPIWNKGPRSYTFQENRRINQKLTFCLLIAVVLAIGLGLGNLVAHQECEAEYKASQQPPIKNDDQISVPTPTTPAPIIPDRSTDSSMHMKQSKSTVDSFASNEEATIEDLATSNNLKQDKRQINDNIVMDNRPRKRDDPIIDPKYKIHAETVSSVVQTLDQLSRKIDQFENTTRKLQGVLMIPEEESENGEDADNTASTSFFDAAAHNDNEENKKNDDEISLGDEEDEELIIDDLIDAIEQTPDYIEQKRDEKKWEEFYKNRRRSTIFDKVDNSESYPGESNDIELMLKSFQQFKDFQRRFIKSERKRLREEGKYNRASWKLPKEYTAEEKNALKVRYRTNWTEFLKLAKNKVPDPIEALFGIEEDEEERTFEDIFRFLDDELPPEEYSELFRKNAEEMQPFEKSLQHSTPDETEQVVDQNMAAMLTRQSMTDVLKQVLDDHENEIDDLIITDDVDVDSYHSDPLAINFNNNEQRKLADPDQIPVENTIGESKSNGKPLREEFPSRKENDPSINQIHYRSSTENLVKNKIHTVAEPNLSIESPQKSKDFSVKHDIIGTDSPGSSKATPDPASVEHVNVKRSPKQKESTNKQTKLKGGSASSPNKNQNKYDNSMNDWSKSERAKSSKNKKVKNMDGNKVFENIKGKNIDKRRKASPETVRNEKFGSNVDKDSGNNRNNRKPATAGINSKDETGKGRDETSYNKQQNKKQANDNRKNDHNARNNKKSQDPKQNERKNMKDQKQHDKNRRDFSGERRPSKSNNQDFKDVPKDSKLRRQKPDSNSRQDSHNTNYEGGKNPKTGKVRRKLTDGRN